MRFTTLIAKNVLHRPVRTALTALGLAIAISAVIVLVGISWNFERGFLAIYRSKGIDLILVRAGSTNQLSSSLDEGIETRLRKLDGVADVAPTLVDTVAFEDKNLAAVLVDGWRGGSLLFRGVRILEGRMLDPRDRDAILLGRILSLNLGAHSGEKLDVAGRTFQVVGVFESDSLFENGALIMPIETLQTMMGRENQVTGFVIKARSAETRDLDALRKRVEQAFPGTAASPARDYVTGDTQIRLSRAMAGTTALVAFFLGGVGMLNTMLMAIFERTRELGLLRAVGWRRRRVILLVLGESFALALVGSLLGCLLAVIGLRVLTLFPTAAGFIDPNLPPEVMPLALLMGVGLSLLGGTYPAIRAASLDPIQALRHE